MLVRARCARALVVGLDGAIGRCVRDAATPHIDTCVAEGVSTFSGLSVLPSSSYAAWGSMFHGVGPETHRLGESRPCPEDVSWPSFMKLLRQRRPDSKLASFSSWEPVNSHIIEESCGCYCVSKPDTDLVIDAVEHIRSELPSLLFVHLDDIDAVGHAHGYGTRSYLEQIARTDALVGLLIDAMKDAGTFDETLLVVLSDHGGHERTHGSDHPDCMNIFWVCRGPGVAQGESLGDLSIVDTAAVIASALSLPHPTGWDARVPEGVFSR